MAAFKSTLIFFLIIFFMLILAAFSEEQTSEQSLSTDGASTTIITSTSKTRLTSTHHPSQSVTYSWPVKLTITLSIYFTLSCILCVLCIFLPSDCSDLKTYARSTLKIGDQ